MRKRLPQNLRKHRVSFNEAASAFRDPLSATFDDADHSEKEQRFLTIGYSSEQDAYSSLRMQREARLFES